MSEINYTEELPDDVFPVNLKLIKKYQCKYTPVYWKYELDSFRGLINRYIKLIICEDHIFIPSILQSYILHWYHTYILHILMDRR